MNTPKVSVLTPVYNVEGYLRQCLESLAAQTLDDIEFICINDGSTDGSLAILQEFAERDGRFVVIDKPNSGYGASMNQGLERARGEYIGIVESDDFIDADAFELLYGLASVNGQPDIVKANHYRYSDKHGDVFVENYGEELCDRVLSVMEEPGAQVMGSIPAIWAAIYRSDFLQENSIDFLETPGASFQDTGFVFKSWVASRSFVLSYAAFLHYRVDNAGSSVKDEGKAYCICDEFASIERFLSDETDRAPVLMPRLMAKKRDAYDWNLRRIDRSLRRGFLVRYISEFENARKLGYLDEELYSDAQWRRLCRMLDNRESFLVEERLDHGQRPSVKVSVVVPVYNAMPYLRKTLRSIGRQTLKDIEVIVVNDGSTDKSQKCIDEFCEKDSRFISLTQENAGVCAARNLALEHVSGEYVAFCDADDLVPAGAYEALYRTMKIERADLAIGQEDEFTLVSKDTYVRSTRLAKKKRISKHDVDINWNLSLCNKLFKASTIRDNGLRFDTDDLITEDGIFLCRYLKYADTIVGCESHVYKYRRHLFFEGRSATQRVDEKAVSSYFESFEKVARLRRECADFDRARFAQSDNGALLASRAEAKGALALEDVRHRTLSMGIERYYRSIWRMTPEAVSLLVRSLEELRNQVYPEHWDAICKHNADLALEEGFKTPEEFARRVWVTIILMPQANEDTFRLHLESIFLQRFPSFELLVSERNRAWTPESVASLPNVRFIPASTRSEMVVAGCKAAKGPFVNILEDRIFHTNASLRLMWKELVGSRADFVCVKLGGIRNRRKARELVTSDLLYSDEFAGTPSNRTRFVAFDSSFNNKLFRTRLLERALPLTEDAAADMVRLFQSLSFVKLPGVVMSCFESDAFFVGRVQEPLKTEYKLFYRWRAIHPYESGESAKGKARASRIVPRVKQQVLFCSNREDNRLSANMQLVHDALPSGVRKVVFCEPLPHSTSYLAELRRALRQSKVIVTDDYIHELRAIDLQEDQHVIQLWHACGVLKKFGLDNVSCNIKRERSVHRQYDAVMVSDESVRGVYARAFGVAKNVVKALGVPRTDMLFDERAMLANREGVYGKHPELRDKRIVLYCPTFREQHGRQSRWDPGIDWEALDASLEADQVLVVKEHPLEISDFTPGVDLKRVIELDDVSAYDLMLLADALITDCSSIVYDFSLLDRPVIFYFPDFDSFDRDFYVDFPTDLGGSLVMAASDLANAIQDALDHPGEYLVKGARDGMMSACDGSSTERIARYIMQRLES